ncbi:MAG: hypothetical protein A2Z94_01255 [Gallionellales bacterium GWA2_55_18]|nr:MAG: hypothetical protein A2Z94_01255 [Gallionellales bacterium GWA2_55_18]
MNYTIDSNNLLIELRHTEHAIDAAETLIQTLKAKQASITKILDEITRPPKRSIREILEEAKAHANQSHATTEKVKIGFEIHGEFVECTSCLDIHRKFLKRMWKDFPNQREAMASAVKRVGNNRQYISKERENLFKWKDAWWVRKHSRELSDGWYFDINVTPERIKRILPIIVSTIGLKWDADVVITWS